jgi:hypothetical protein
MALFLVGGDFFMQITMELWQLQKIKFSFQISFHADPAFDDI